MFEFLLLENSSRLQTSGDEGEKDDMMIQF